MFAGIGYFTLPLAKFAHPSKIYACEKNPDSYEFLVKNVELNDVKDIVEPILSDNRDLDLGTHFDGIRTDNIRIPTEGIGDDQAWWDDTLSRHILCARI